MLKKQLDFVKLEDKGFSLCEIVKALSEEYQTSERNIYYDAETRDTWQCSYQQCVNLWQRHNSFSTWKVSKSDSNKKGGVSVWWVKARFGADASNGFWLG